MKTNAARKYAGLQTQRLNPKQRNSLYHQPLQPKTSKCSKPLKSELPASLSWTCQLQTALHQLCGDCFPQTPILSALTSPLNRTVVATCNLLRKTKLRLEATAGFETTGPRFRRIQSCLRFRVIASGVGYVSVPSVWGSLGKRLAWGKLQLDGMGKRLAWQKICKHQSAQHDRGKSKCNAGVTMGNKF